jgi:hypothetical protein
MSSHKRIIESIAAIRAHLRDIETLGEPPHIKGYRFESEFLEECKSRRLDAKKARGAQHYDLLVCGLRVQCKCVVPNDIGLVFIQPGQRTWYVTTDFDVLAMKCLEVTYIIPMESLPMSNGHVRIGIKPSGLHRWVSAWDVFSGDRVGKQEKTLFDGLSEEITP